MLFPEIVAVSKVSKKEIGRVFKLILKTLETNVDLITTGDFMVRLLLMWTIPSIGACYSTFSNRVDLDFIGRLNLYLYFIFSTFLL